MTRITATYDIESPIGVAAAAAVVAGEQSTGTFTRLAAETDALRARSAARIEDIVITGTSATPSLPSRKTGTTYERGRVTVFVKQVVRRFHAASLISGALISFSGFNQTGPAGCQFRVFPDQRCGFWARAVA